MQVNVLLNFQNFSRLDKQTVKLPNIFQFRKQIPVLQKYFQTFKTLYKLSI